MASIREQILDDLITKLNTGTPVGVPAAVRSYGNAVEPASLPHMNVYPVSEDVSLLHPPGLTAARRSLSVAVECRAAGDVSTPGDVATDAMVDWVVQALGALEPVTGLYEMVVESNTTFERATLEQPFAMTTVFFTVSYLTKSNDISSQTWT